MDTNELILTSIVLKHATMRRKEAATDLSVEPPPLDAYIAPAVDELKAWHPVVMQAVRKSQT